MNVMQKTLYTAELQVGWGDLDANGHMRNTAYLDRSADVRMMYFKSHGFAMSEFERLRFGPVIKRDDIEYFREMKLLESFRGALRIAGLSADGSRFRFRNEFFKPDGTLVARVTSAGGWLDLSARRLAAPPPELAQAMSDLATSEDYAEIVKEEKK